MDFLFGRQDGESISRSLRQNTVQNAFIVIATCIFLFSSSTLVRAWRMFIGGSSLYKLFTFKIKTLVNSPSVPSARVCALNIFSITSLSLPHPTDTSPS